MRVPLNPSALRRDVPRRRAGAGHNRSGAWPWTAAEVLEARALLAAAPDVGPLTLAPVPLGPEFAVNTHAAGSQELFAEAPRAVAAADDGSFVVAWSSSGQDGSSWGVYAQRFDAAGAKRGDEFRVNQSTGNSQWYPSVAFASPNVCFIDSSMSSPPS